MTRSHAQHMETLALHYAINSTTILTDLELTINKGKVLGVVGPNGSGKTTLLRLLIGSLKPSSGRIVIGDAAAKEWVDTHQLSGLQRARIHALVEQNAHPHDDLTVGEVIALGRLPHQNRFSGIDPHSPAVIEAASRVGVEEFLHRSFASLSGGERQRVHVARALAQAPQFLLLDEPTNHLDIAAQLELLTIISQVARNGTGVVVTLHDLGLAARVCDDVVVVDQGHVVGIGPPLETLTPPLIEQVWGVEAQWVEALGKPTLVVGTKPAV